MSGEIRRELSAEEVAQIVSEHYASVIEAKRDAIESGDGDALLSALLNALISRDPLPDWLCGQIASAIYRYQHHDAFSLDEAFRVSRPSGYRQKARREQRRVGTVVAYDVRALVRAGAVVDEALFAAVGKLHGVGKTTASKWYYWHLKRSYLPPSEWRMERAGLPDKLRAIEGDIEWRN